MMQMDREQSEMVERVARAIATARCRGNLDEFTDKEKWADAVDAYDLTNNNGRFAYDQEARAAIEAMREPTEAMGVAGGLEFEAIAFEPDTDGAGIVFTDMGRVFTCMIDAALHK